MMQELPEKDVPQNLHDSIMKVITAQKKPFRDRVFSFLRTSLTIKIQPLRLAGAIIVLAAVFWLGLLTGNHFPGPIDKSGNVFDGLPVTSDNAEAHYLMGRGLLTGGQPAQAVHFFEQAYLLDSSNPEYALWEGVALGKQENQLKEREIYQRIIRRHPEYLPARLYLGHNLLEAGLLPEALREYTNVLNLYPREEAALYNKALTLQLMNKPEQETVAWKEYLRVNREGKWAYRAVGHLNQLGNFSYRTYQIGYRKIILNQNDLLGEDTVARQREIDILVRSFANSPGNELNLILYRLDDAERAEAKAIRLRNQLYRALDGRKVKKIQISWFGTAERIRSEAGKQNILPEGILIFSQPEVQQSKEKMI